MSRKLEVLPGCKRCDKTNKIIADKATNIILDSVKTGINPYKYYRPTSRVIEPDKKVNSSSKKYVHNDRDFMTRPSPLGDEYFKEMRDMPKVSKGNMSDTSLLKVNTPSGVYYRTYKDRDYDYNEPKNKLNNKPFFKVEHDSKNPLLGVQNVPDNNKFTNKHSLYESNREQHAPMTYNFYTNKKVITTN